MLSHTLFACVLEISGKWVLLSPLSTLQNRGSEKLSVVTEVTQTAGRGAGIQGAETRRWEPHSTSCLPPVRRSAPGSAGGAQVGSRWAWGCRLLAGAGGLGLAKVGSVLEGRRGQLIKGRAASAAQPGSGAPAQSPGSCLLSLCSALREPLPAVWPAIPRDVPSNIPAHMSSPQESSDRQASAERKECAAEAGLRPVSTVRRAAWSKAISPGQTIHHRGSALSSSSATSGLFSKPEQRQGAGKVLPRAPASPADNRTTASWLEPPDLRSLVAMAF